MLRNKIVPPIQESQLQQNPPDLKEPVIYPWFLKNKWFKTAVLIVFFTIFFFLPLPYYQAQVAYCKPCPSPPGYCSPCPSPGWHFGPSIARRLFPDVTSGPPHEESSIFSPTPTSDPTANWKTYSSEAHLFEIKYPPDWYLNEEEPNVEVGSVPKTEYLHGVGIPPKGNLWVTIVKQDTSGNDKEEIIEVGPNNFIINQVIFKKNKGSFYKIIGGFWKDDAKESFNRSILNQILSTFKFLPASPTGGDQKQAVNNSKSCQQDSDCVLWLCTGCVNKEWAKTSPAEPPCATYYGYSCQCTGNKCLEIK